VVGICGVLGETRRLVKWSKERAVGEQCLLIKALVMKTDYHSVASFSLRILFDMPISTMYNNKLPLSI
jgi:hypothetical protein